MIRILLILVGVGVLINALTFLIVAQSISKDKGTVSTAKPGGPPPDAPLSAELSRRLSGLETTLGTLTKKIEGISSRPPIQPSATNPMASRSSKQRTSFANRSGTPGGTDAGAAIEEPPPEEAPAPAEPPAPEPKATEPAPVQDPGQQPAPVEGEKPMPAPGDGPPPPPADGAAGSPDQPPAASPAGNGTDGQPTESSRRGTRAGRNRIRPS